jgi:hypothetical protein
MSLPFDRPLDGESDKAYAAFCVYRDLPVHERSIDAAYTLARYPKSTVKKLAAKNWYLWSVDFSWVDRARSSDVYNDRVFREAREAAIIKAQRLVLKHELDAAIDLIETGKKLMKMPPVKITKQTDDGRAITYMPANANYIAQGAKMVMEGIKALRLAGGMTGSISTLETSVREGVWIEIVNLMKAGEMNEEQAKVVIGDTSLEDEFFQYYKSKDALV